MVSASRLYLGNASRIASVSRLKSHFSGSWLLIRKMSFSPLMGLPASSTRFSLQLRRIFSNTSYSLKDFFRFSARTSSSIFVRMKKKDFPCFLISRANMMSFLVNRLLAKIRYVWYLSSCTFWRYVIMNFKKTEGFSWSGERLKRYEYEWNSLGITGSFRRWKWKCIKDRCYNHEASSAYSLNLSSLFSVIRKGEFRWKATKNCSLKDFIAAVTGKWNI